MIYALRFMRRVAITGFGAVTPIGLDALSTWESAVAGRSGIGFIESFDASEFPGPDRRRGAWLRPLGADPGQGGAADGPQRPARRRRRAGGLGRGGHRGVRPGARRHSRRLRDRRHRDDRRAAAGLPRARRRPRLAVLHPVGARRHGERPDRDPARHHRPELRAGLRLRDRLDGDRRGRRDDRARPGRHRPRGRHRGRDHPAHPRRLLRDAGARGRGRRPDARDAPVRRDAGRLRDGRGCLHPGARGARVGEGARRHDLRGGASATAPRTTRTTSPSPSPRRPGSRR